MNRLGNTQRGNRNQIIKVAAATALSALAIGASVAAGANRLGPNQDNKNVAASVKDRFQNRKMGAGVHFNCLSLRPEQRAVVFDDLEKNNINLVRMNLNWNDIEPSKGIYDQSMLTKLDDCINQAVQNSIKSLIVFQGSPEWANGSKNWNYPAINPDDYANAIGFLAGRYTGKVMGWEPGNEPNFESFWHGTPEQLVAQMQKAYIAVKKADPKAYMLLPGIAQNDSNYLDRLYRAGVKGNFNILSTHIYPDTSSADPSRVGAEITQGFQAILNVMDKYGDKSPVWLTEFGFPRGPQISSELQAQMALSTIAGLRKLTRVKAAFWFQAQDSGSGDWWEKGVAAIDDNGAPWPVLSVIGKLLTGTSINIRTIQTKTVK